MTQSSCLLRRCLQNFAAVRLSTICIRRNANGARRIGYRKPFAAIRRYRTSHRFGVRLSCKDAKATFNYYIACNKNNKMYARRHESAHITWRVGVQHPKHGQHNTQVIRRPIAAVSTLNVYSYNLRTCSNKKHND